MQLPDPQQHLAPHASGGTPRRHLCSLLVYGPRHGGVSSGSSEHRCPESSGVRVAQDARRVRSVARSCRRPPYQYLPLVSLRCACSQQWYVHYTLSFWSSFLLSHLKQSPPLVASTTSRAPVRVPTLLAEPSLEHKLWVLDFYSISHCSPSPRGFLFRLHRPLPRRVEVRPPTGHPLRPLLLGMLS